MAQQNKVQLLDVPYTDDWNAYSFNMSINNALTSLQNQIDALNTRVDKEGVITGGDDIHGWYVKFPDGKVLQGKFFPAPGASDVTWTFPIEFIDTAAYCTVCAPGTGSFAATCQVLTRTKANATYRTHDANGAQANSGFHVIAMGRWK